MIERKKNAFIVSKALGNFVFAAVLTAAATQLAHTGDSMIVGHTIGPDAVSAINLCCEELMTNIAGYSSGKVVQHSFDVHIDVNQDEVLVSLKDAGRPFDPITAGKMSDKHIGAKDYEHLGLRLVTNIIPDITYKYMYGQNTVFIHLNRAK